MPHAPDPSWCDGLRSLRADELPALDLLLSAAFRPGIIEQYPHIYSPENAPNLRVVVKEGKVVSHIGTIRRHASILGCTVKVASMGGVGTLPEHRGKGYATALFADTVRACRRAGIDFIVVSGYRKLYHRHGCRYIGRDWNFSLPGEKAAALTDASLSLRTARPEEIPALAALYQREPVRWLRPLSDFHHALSGYVMNRPHEMLTVWENGHLRGYIILQEKQSEDENKVQLLEFAGDRRSLVGVLGRLVQERNLEALDVHVMGCDLLLQDLLKERGLEGQPAHAAGTVSLVDFPQFMERMRPYFAERIGPDAAAGLVFYERDDALVFAYGGDQVVAPDRGAAVELIFGTSENSEEPLLQSGGQAGDLLRRIFPIPALWYGINYV